MAAEAEDAVQAANEPENVQVARGPIWKRVWRVEVPGALIGQLPAPALKGAQVEGDPGQKRRAQPHQEAERQYDDDRARPDAEIYLDGRWAGRFRIHRAGWFLVYQVRAQDACGSRRRPSFGRLRTPRPRSEGVLQTDEGRGSRRRCTGASGQADR